MFISVLDLFKIGIGPSSSHTFGPMMAAHDFLGRARVVAGERDGVEGLRLVCTLKGSLAYTGRGHATDRAVVLGLHGHTPASLADQDIETLWRATCTRGEVALNAGRAAAFDPARDLIFDQGEPFQEHPNGLRFELMDGAGTVLLAETYFSIGGGFICTQEEIAGIRAPLAMVPADACPHPFDSAAAMLAMAARSGLSIAAMKEANELRFRSRTALEEGLEAIWQAMRRCVESGLSAEGELPGGLHVRRRARHLHAQLLAEPDAASVNDWLSVYAMAVNEENAAGHLVVTAPTNGAAGVIPAVLYHLVMHEGGGWKDVRTFLLTAAAVGGIIKHRSSISGAEVGCQGEVGSAAAMAAAGRCAVRGGTPAQVEHAAEIALEHHLGMTCDPVRGLVQVPCIERNAFGAIKAYAAASLALRGMGEHVMTLDACIAAMKQTGLEMSHKFKETALGGLAVAWTEC
ncbi:MAG TPA: L-serine ammonia-lyase [Chromatiales bacterium]|nr:L-serine ammonia-lyase [Chromatiales bacterium]